MTGIVAVYSMKGGVGKTTIAVNLAWRSAEHARKRTLLWDIDANAALHRLRIEGKKLRYGCDFFASLFPAHAATRRRKAFAGALGQLQESLGQLHDMAVAAMNLGALFEGHEPIAAARLEAELASLLDGHGPSRRKLLKQAGRSLEKIAEAKPWWQPDTLPAVAKR